MMNGTANKSANDECSNGNGGLMRIPPLAFMHIENDEKLLNYIKLFNECSHNHEISHIGCLIYVKLAERLMEGENIAEALKNVVISTPDRYKIPQYARIWDLSILSAKRYAVISSGFVVSTLEAVIWCCANNNSYKEAVLSAVNLGDDTDTVGALTGFLAGICFGDIPEQWIKNIHERNIAEKLCEKMLRGDF
jgi:ADP-ribosylglycohydrolase